MFYGFSAKNIRMLIPIAVMGLFAACSSSQSGGDGGRAKSSVSSVDSEASETKKQEDEETEAKVNEPIEIAGAYLVPKLSYEESLPQQLGTAAEGGLRVAVLGKQDGKKLAQVVVEHAEVETQSSERVLSKWIATSNEQFWHGVVTFKRSDYVRVQSVKIRVRVLFNSQYQPDIVKVISIRK